MAQEFYFAWLDNGGIAFGPAHHVFDEQVVGFQIDHMEAEIPGAKIVVRNPKVGLLNPARKQWAWISWRKPDNTVVPLFHGRLVAMPTDLIMELVTLDFHARPQDYEEQKKTLANSLKVVPYWDPVFINETQLENPDIVLQARPQLWHVGRTDKTLTVSHILQGEAGTVVLGPSEVIGRRASISYGAPLDHVKLEASVEWTQSAFGRVNMSEALRKEFDGLVCSYTGEGLERTWPVYGDEIGGGWSVDYSQPRLQNKSVDDSTVMIVHLDPRNDTPDIQEEDWWATSNEGYDYWYQKAYDEWLAERMLDPIKQARFPRWDFRPEMWVRYEANRARKEVLSIKVTADVQRFFTDEKVEDEQVTSLNAASTVVDKVLPSRRVNSYFSSDRGQQSIAYLLNIMRSVMLLAARAVAVTVDIPWLIGIQLSCRHDILLSLPELPGGVAGGKVVGYQLLVQPESGQMTCSVTFAAVVGKGNTLGLPAGGVESYVDDDYVEDSYQIFWGESLQPVAGELEYVRPTYKPTGDDIDFENMTADNVLLDLAATALLTFSGTGGDGQTITIGARVYTLKNALTAANQVLIGSMADGTAHNLADAINRDEAREGFTFGTGTVAHANVEATVEGAIVRVTARVGGKQGNSIAVSSTAPAATWDQPNLYDGNDGLVALNKAPQQEAHMGGDEEPGFAGSNAPGSVELAIERLNEVPTMVQMALKPVTGGPFETAITLSTSPLMVPKTIDLAAAAL